jgi:hypothetical protein
VLRAAGFAVHEHRFEFSAVAGRYGAPAVGASSMFAITIACSLALTNDPRGALLTVAAAGFLIALFGMQFGRGMLDSPLAREEGHVDSKSQPVPILWRAAGVVVLIVGAIWFVLLVLASLAGAAVGAVALWASALVALVGAAPLLASTVGDRSHGAADNGSGLAAVLAAAERVAPGASVGVVVTDAEELGLAGARAFARDEGRRAIVLNCDTVDDRGAYTLLTTRGTAMTTIGALRVAAEGLMPEEELRVIRHIPGILTDALALSGAGWDAVTLARGTIATLARIHTVRDTLEAMNGDGIDGAATILARSAEALA